MHRCPSKHNERSHKPYGKDVPAKLKKLITESFDKTENDTLDKVCETIANGVLETLGFVQHKNTFMVAIVDKKKYDA